MNPERGYPDVVGEIQSPKRPQHPGTGNVDTRTDDLTTLVPGTHVGKYRIVGVLGQGGFGITYRAVDTQLDREVAIKEYLPASFAVRRPDFSVLPRSTQVAEDFRWGRERFLAEAKTLARLTDAPGVVDVFDYLEAYGTAYMVMALVQGETLDARLRREGRLPQLVIDQLLYPLLDGLEQVHEAGFLHRDIKPDNILIDAFGRPTLIDFGASRAALQGRFKALTAVYTPGYAAVEQVTSGEQGPWTDIYALSATLYHCITGNKPPSAIERMAEGTSVSAAEAGKDRYTTGLLAAIDAGLSLKAAGRPQSIVDWRRILSDGSPSTRPSPARTPPRDLEPTIKVNARPEKGSRRLRAVAAIIALCLIGAGAYVVFRPPVETAEEAARRIEEEAQRHAERAAQARKAAEEERQRQEEARKAAEEKAKAEKAEAARKAAEEERERRDEESRKAAEDKATAERAEAARQAADAERARAAEEAQRKAEAARRADEEAQRRADAERARQEAELARLEAERKAAEAARIRSEEEARRKSEAVRKAAEAAQRQAEEERRRIEAENARREAERAAAEAKRKAEEQAKAEREKAEQEARQRREEEAARRAAEERARAEAAAREKAEADARAKADAEAKRRAETEEAALKLSEIDRRKVQVALSALGFDTQGADGAFGPRTRQMIVAWQKRHGHPETGYLTAPQLASLREQAASALAKFDEDQKRAMPPAATPGKNATAERCRALNARAEIGETLSPAEIAFLRSGCR